MLVGCAPARQSYDRTAHPEIKKIALTTIKEPTYGIGDTSGGLFGVVGAAAVAGATQSKAERFNAAMRQQDLHLGAELTDAIEAELRAHGYEVSRVDVDRQAPNRLLESYDGVQVEADALLDVVIFDVGFITAPLRDYLPVETVYLRLVKLPTREVLYSDRPMYSTMFIAQVRPPAENAKNTFGTFDEMMADPATVAKVFETSVKPMADFLGRALAGSAQRADISVVGQATPVPPSPQ